MRGDVDDIRLGMLARVTAAFAAEIDVRDPAAAIAWEAWPDVASLVDHLGVIHRWAAEVVRTGEQADRASLPRSPGGAARAWYEECRADLLEALATAPRDRAGWIIGGRTGAPGFWIRRMLYESTKHLVDVRAAGGGAMTPPPELAPVDFADGVDELFEVWLTRTAPGLAPLRSPLVLRATDHDRAWTISTRWEVAAGADARAVTLSATAGDLALAVWERADPLAASDRFGIEGDPDVVAAFRAAAIHP